VFVKRIIEVGTANKRIEQRTTRKRADAAVAAATGVEV
jgi:3-oxoacid CoA-transferase subunit A